MCALRRGSPRKTLERLFGLSLGGEVTAIFSIVFGTPAPLAVLVEIQVGSVSMISSIAGDVPTVLVFSDFNFVHFASSLYMNH